MKDFQLNDRVHWTRNGNTTPGTVIRRTKTRTYVRRDKFTVQQRLCDPVPVTTRDYVCHEDPLGPVLVFTLRGNDQWILQGHKVPMGGNRLKIGWKACSKP